MGYRHEHKDHGMDVVLPIDNGTISHISIPCFRRPPFPPGRHRDEHNHQGWPSPDSPDDTCQGPWDGDEPDVDLLEEGYDFVEVSLLDQPEGFSVAGQIDGNKVRLTITAVCEAAETECVNVPFAVYLLGSEKVEGKDEPVVTMRDLAAKGVIHIVEGPVGESTPWVAPTTESRIEESVTEHVNERIDGQLEQLDKTIDQKMVDINALLKLIEDGIVTVDKTTGDVTTHAGTWKKIDSAWLGDTPEMVSRNFSPSHKFDYDKSTFDVWYNEFQRRVVGYVRMMVRAKWISAFNWDGTEYFTRDYELFIDEKYRPICFRYLDGFCHGRVLKTDFDRENRTIKQDWDTETSASDVNTLPYIESYKVIHIDGFDANSCPIGFPLTLEYHNALPSNINDTYDFVVSATNVITPCVDLMFDYVTGDGPYQTRMWGD